MKNGKSVSQVLDNCDCSLFDIDITTGFHSFKMRKLWAKGTESH